MILISMIIFIVVGVFVMLKKDKYYDLECINKARVLLLGIAAFMVVIYHTPNLNYNDIINIRFINMILRFIQRIGNYGVDIFLFLSGIGLYFSLSKNSIKQFYRNRFLRILPEYLMVLILYNIFCGTFSIVEILKPISGWSFFAGESLDGWYVAFIMVMYLIFPIIYKMIKKYDLSALFVGLLIVFVINLLISSIFSIFYLNIELALTRIPVFLIGVYFGKFIYEKRKLHLNLFILSFIIQLLILFVLCMILEIKYFDFFARYLYCPLAVSSVINISWLYNLLKNKNIFLLKPLMFFGNHSLEIYLIFEKTCYVLRKVYLIPSYLIVYSLSFVITIVLAWLLKELINLLINNLFKKK